MVLTYRFLSDEAKNSIKSDVAKRRGPSPEPKVDDATIAAWEADHFTHSQLLESETDEDQRKVHEDAMKTIEQAIAKAAARNTAQGAGRP